ncbi:hypothetical protein PQX77_021717 [Marasmius sp. AFHP31]|nr:hypothetical protein PQX77_021717 [Marasmius sp. AFHP31]
MTFVYTALETGDDSSLRNYVTNDKLHSVDAAIYDAFTITANFIADLMLVHRCYVVWNYNRRVWILFGLTSLINALGLVSTIAQSVGLNDTKREWKLLTAGTTMRSVYGCAYAAANLLITVLTALRIWRLSREARETFGSRTRGFYERIVAIILESGALYPIIGFVQVALWESASKIGKPINLSPTVTLMAGIAPALMIVRCRVLSNLQNHSNREADTLSTLRFDLTTGTGTTPAQTGSQARDVEAQSELSGTAEDSKGESRIRDEEKGTTLHSRSSLPRAL